MKWNKNETKIDEKVEWRRGKERKGEERRGEERTGEVRGGKEKKGGPQGEAALRQPDSANWGEV